MISFDRQFFLKILKFPQFLGLISIGETSLQRIIPFPLMTKRAFLDTPFLFRNTLCALNIPFLAQNLTIMENLIFFVEKG